MSADQNDDGSEGYKRLEQIAARIKSGEPVEPVILREFLGWFGAQRRSIPTNRMIREALCRADLRIKPDLHETFLDDEVEFHAGNIERVRAEALRRDWMRFELLTARLAAWIDQTPGVTQSEIRAKAVTIEKLGFGDFSPEEINDLADLHDQFWQVQIAEQTDKHSKGLENLQQIAARLKSGRTVELMTVRELLGSFGTERRNLYTSYVIRSALRNNNLRTKPDFNEQFLENNVEFIEGYELTKIDAALLNETWLQLFNDRLVSWIDQNPRATESEVRAQASAFGKAGFEELPSDQGAEIRVLFPAMDPKILSRILSRVTKPNREGPLPTKPPSGSTPLLREQHFIIQYGDMGHTYDNIFGPYLAGAKLVTVEDPYIRASHQIANFQRFCGMVVRVSPTVQRINLITGYDGKTDRAMVSERLEGLKKSLRERDVLLDIQYSDKLHDREVRIDNGWIVKIGRGLDFYQRPDGWYSVDANDFAIRRCLETKVDIFKQS